MADGLLFTGRVPPSNLQAEQALLGAILSNNRAYDLVAAFLEPEHFADPINGRIFQSIVRRIAAGGIADAVSLKAEFENSGILDEVGGTKYLAQLLSAMVGVLNAAEYGRAVHDTWVRRQLIDAAAEATQFAYGSDPNIDGAAAIEAATSRLLELGTRRTDDAGGSIEDALEGVMRSAEAMHRGTGTAGLLTGIKSVDEAWRGLWPGSLDYIAAASKHGKTAIGMQICQNVAEALRGAGSGEHVQIFSLEMPRHDIGLRMLAAETGISADDIRSGQIGGDRASALIQAQAKLRSLPMLIEDQPGLTLSQIRIRMRIAKRRRKTRLVLIDFIQRIQPDPGMGKAPRNEQVALISQALKDEAKSLGLPILVLAQFSQQWRNREDKRPVESDIEYGGVRDADNIALLWRPELVLGSRPPDTPIKMTEDKRSEMIAQWRAQRDAVKDRAEMIFSKRRFGPTSSVWLHFDGPKTTFSELLDEEAQQAMF